MHFLLHKIKYRLVTNNTNRNHGISLAKLALPENSKSSQQSLVLPPTCKKGKKALRRNLTTHLEMVLSAAAQQFQILVILVDKSTELVHPSSFPPSMLYFPEFMLLLHKHVKMFSLLVRKKYPLSLGRARKLFLHFFFFYFLSSRRYNMTVASVRLSDLSLPVMSELPGQLYS